MMRPIVGIDISKHFLDVVLIHVGHSHYKTVDNDAAGFLCLRNWLKAKGCHTAHICMEATGQYGDAVAVFLHSHGYHISVVNPARTKAYAASRLKRNKTDKADALLIAEFCQNEKPPLWTPPRPVFQALKALVHQLDDLMAIKQQEYNRLEFSASVTLVNAILHEHIEFLEAKIKVVQKAISELIEQDSQLKHQKDLLLSIPGIGERTAARLLAEIRDFREFRNARQLAAYAGLNPRQHISGSSIHRKTRLSKTGNATLRRALFMPAVVAKKHNPIIKDFCQRLSDTGLTNMAVIGAAMRKLLHLAFGVIKTDSPFDPYYLQKEVIHA